MAILEKLISKRTKVLDKVVKEFLFSFQWVVGESREWQDYVTKILNTGHMYNIGKHGIVVLKWSELAI